MSAILDEIERRLILTGDEDLNVGFILGSLVDHLRETEARLEALEAPSAPPVDADDERIIDALVSRATAKLGSRKVIPVPTVEVIPFPDDTNELRVNGIVVLASTVRPTIDVFANRLRAALGVE